MGSKHSKGTTSTSYPIPYNSFRVPFESLQEATNNFDDKFLIAEGGFGKVYRGVLCDGTKVALKRRKPESEQGIEEFQTEIEALSQFRHPYLVSLIGYCDENNELILIYEYMENGNLSSHLYGTDLCLSSMSWEQRLEICIGAARGLHYLHTSGIIHCDVKSANILLDENFVAKVADFGLSKTMHRSDISTSVKGSFGYLDPEYFRSLQLTEKSDVYSFGVVLCEALCARPAIDLYLQREQINLAEWAVKCHKNIQLNQIIDSDLLGEVRPDSLRKFGETAVKCLADYGVNRPSMSEVLWNLEYALHLQEPVIQDDDEKINDASSNVAQIGSSNLDDLSSDEVISPR